VGLAGLSPGWWADARAVLAGWQCPTSAPVFPFQRPQGRDGHGRVSSQIHREKLPRDEMAIDARPSRDEFIRLEVRGPPGLGQSDCRQIERKPFPVQFYRGGGATPPANRFAKDSFGRFPSIADPSGGGREAARHGGLPAPAGGSLEPVEDTLPRMSLIGHPPERAAQTRHVPTPPDTATTDTRQAPIR